MSADNRTALGKLADHVTQPRRSPGGTRATIEATGDAVSPTIESGALLDVDLADTRVHSGGGVYVLEVDGLPLVRRLMSLGDGTVEVGCDNPKNRSRVAPRERLKVLGRVVCQMAWREL